MSERTTPLSEIDEHLAQIRRVAAARLAALRDEIAQIEARFPGLATPPKKVRKYSDAERAARAQRMREHWVKARAEGRSFSPRNAPRSAVQ